MPSRLLGALLIASAQAEDCLTTFAGKVGLHKDVGPYAPLKACNKVKAGEAALNGDDPETVCNSAYKIAGTTFKTCKCARPRPSPTIRPARPRKPLPRTKKGGRRANRGSGANRGGTHPSGRAWGRVPHRGAGASPPRAILRAQLSSSLLASRWISDTSRRIEAPTLSGGQKDSGTPRMSDEKTDVGKV